MSYKRELQLTHDGEVIFKKILASIENNNVQSKSIDDEWKCPKCGSTNTDEDVWTYDDADDYFERWCKDCGFRVAGDYWTMMEAWKSGISNVE